MIMECLKKMGINYYPKVFLEKYQYIAKEKR